MIADLTGNRALVTGAGTGIGHGIAAVLAEQGAMVAVTDLDADTARSVAEEIGESRSLALGLDVTDRGSADRAAQSVLTEWGGLEILVNNAGVASAPGRRTDEGDREVDWDVTFDINVKGVVHCTEAVLPHMRERKYGKIINIASIAGARRVRSQQGGRDSIHAGAGCERGAFQHQRQHHLSGRGVDAPSADGREGADQQRSVARGRRSGASLPRPLRADDAARSRADARGHREGGGVPGVGGREEHHWPVPQRRWRGGHTVGRS